MYCWNCGKENRQDALYCRYCGEKLTTAFETKDIANGELSVFEKQTSSMDNVDHETDQYSRISRGVRQCPKCGGAMFVHHGTAQHTYQETAHKHRYVRALFGALPLFFVHLATREKAPDTIQCEQCGYTLDC